MTDFWRDLTGDELLLNLHGDPPYNADAAAFEVCRRLEQRTMPTFLEIGVGMRRLASVVEWINDGGAFVLGVDVNRDCADFDERTTLVLGDGALPWDAEFFDGAYAVTVFQHLPEDVQRRYLAELARVLRPGGRVVIQHVLGEERGPQSRQVGKLEWAKWCLDADLGLDGVEPDPIRRDWIWFTMEKPS
jgi:SAM-dependent methyltransferase